MVTDGTGVAAISLVIFAMRTSLTPFLSVLVIFSFLFSACGSDKERSNPEDPAPESCSANWKTIFSPEQSLVGFPSRALFWSEGRLFTDIYGGPTPRSSRSPTAAVRHHPAPGLRQGLLGGRAAIALCNRQRGEGS